MSDHPKIAAWLTALVGPAQALEKAFQQLLVLRTLDTATGVQLDVLGKLVGQDRIGLADTDYRRYIRARITANRSGGGMESIIKVVRLVLNDSGASVTIDEIGLAAYVVRVLGVVLDDSLVQILISFIRSSSAAGVRAILEYPTAADSDTFFTARAAFASSNFSSGAGTISVGSTAGFPSSGSLAVDTGLSVAETVTYSGKTLTTFTGVATLGHNHSIHTCLTLAGASAKGKGLGSSSDATLGGKLAAATV